MVMNVGGVEHLPGQENAAVKEPISWVVSVASAEDGKFISAVATELARARGLFPDPICCFPALIEEVGELASELLVDDPTRAYAEAVQVAVMAQRVAVDGDKSITGDSLLTLVMAKLGELARTYLKYAAGKRTIRQCDDEARLVEHAIFRLRERSDPTIRVTDATVIGNM